MQNETLFYNPKFFSSWPSKLISSLLILALLLTQCPYEAKAASASAPGGSSTPLAPFQSEFYRTDLITGTASLSIPIVVPPGRHGIQPNLAINYSSAAGNSLCGVGWNLDLGAIQRDTRVGIPKYDNTDTFIAAVSGANMKLVNIGGLEYRAKIESGFLKFFYQESGNYWQVWDKSGTKYRFGYNSDSKVTNPSGTLKWCLDQVLDTNGNYLSVSYTQEQGQIYPAQIEYTGNKNTGYLPKHTVDFILEARTDLSSSYRSGYKVITAKRLQEIAVTANNEWVRRYVLDYNYSPDTNRSLLKSVVEYGQDGQTPLPSPKTFTYTARGTNPGGALYENFKMIGGTKTINGTVHFNSITLKNGAVLTCDPGSTGMTLLVDEFVKLESGSRIDLDGQGYPGGAGGSGGAASSPTREDAYGRGATKGAPGSGPGAGSEGTDGGDGTVQVHISTYGDGGGGGGGGTGATSTQYGHDLSAPGGAAGILPNAATYDQSSVHVGSGGAGGSGGGGGGASWSAGVSFYGGAGGPGGQGGAGGGSLKIVCASLTIDSDCFISAKGQDGEAGGYGGSGGKHVGGNQRTGGGGGGGHGAGGGSGGGIYLEVTGTLTNNGLISVDGGKGGAGGPRGRYGKSGEDGLQGPGGSGGRIELYYGTKAGSGTYGYSGGSGSINGDIGVLGEETTPPTETSSLPSSSRSSQTFSENTQQLNTATSQTGNNLWSVCFVHQDRGGDNHGPEPPFQTGSVYAQASYSGGGVWWQIDSDGDIHYGGNKDYYLCAWTHLYVEQAKTISLSYYNEVDHNAGFYLSDESNREPRLVDDRTNITLSPGHNILYITSYNENQGFQLEMDGGLASQVDWMNSSLPQLQVGLWPIMGDFNGDGRVDVGRYYNQNGLWQIALSQEDDIISYSGWISNFGKVDFLTPAGFDPIVSDFNNDGFTDIGIFNRDLGSWKIALSDGTRFNSAGEWLQDFGANSYCLPIVGDFNGDTKIDVGTYHKSNGNWSVALNGASFTPDDVWLSGFGGQDAYDALVGDFNGDGLTDVTIHQRGSGDVSVALCNGSTFIPSGTHWTTGFAINKTMLTGDFNNDGLADIGSFDKEEDIWTSALSTGASFGEEGCWLKGFTQGETFSAHTGDFSGDGITNAGIFNWDNETWDLIPSTEAPSDLLVEFANGIGGKTTITYQPSTVYDNTGRDNLSDLPFPIQTVSEVKIEDGLGNSPQIINYTYEDGLFDYQEKEFIGFGQVTVTDTERNIAQTQYNQERVETLYLYKGMPVKQQLQKQLEDGSIELYQQKTYIYDYTTPYPGLNYFPYLTQEESSSYETEFTPKTSKVTYQYDNYGNPTQITSLGDINLIGDEKISNIEYVYNPEVWILGLPYHAYLQDAQGEIISQKWLYYDSHPNYTDTPIKGNLTKEEAWVNTNDQRLTTNYTYDDYGNIRATTDARGNTTTTTYEDTYHLFPKTVTNALGHTLQNTYDYKTGQILTSTDPNGKTSTNEYDVFGRLSKVFGPNDDANHPGIWYEYDLEARPMKIITYAREEYNTDDPNKIRTGYAFYDGLGRLIQTKAAAEEPTKQIVRDVVSFDSRGKVKEKYLPYYLTITTPEEVANFSSPDYTGPKVSFLYDALGRLIESISLNEADLPVSATVQYQPWAKITTDANGHKIGYSYDAYGQLLKVEEYNAEALYATTYKYDVQGNLIQTIDDQGNVTSIAYDSLGRKLSMDDPDMGHWEYKYDAGGNLIKQTDAKGQSITFEYDALNRLTEKSGLSPQGTVPDFSVQYLYDNTNKPNCIGRLSKVTDPSGSSEFFYDNLGREIKSTKTVNSKPYTVNRNYDALDRLTSLIYPNGKVVNYTYNSQGGIESVSSSDGSITNIDYTASDQIKLIQYSNGTQTQYNYHPNTLRLFYLKTTSPNTTLQDLTYQFDNIGNVSTITDNSFSGTNTQSFQYDDLNRLISATGQSYDIISYAYDSIGNITQKGDLTLSYAEAGAGPHAATSLRASAASEAISIDYDPNGNMLTKAEQTFEYDIENRLISTTSLLPSPQGGEGQGEGVISLDLTLTPGWNFVGLPLELSDYSIANALASIAGQYEQVSKYDSTTGDFKSFVNLPKFDQFSQFSFAEGYMIYITEACTLSLPGSVATEAISKELKTGWNLIAAPSLEEITVSGALNNLQENIDYNRIVRYNKDTQLFENLTSTDLLQPGEAYYLYCLKDVTWQIPPPTQTTQFLYDGDGGRVKKSGLSPQGTVPDFFTVYIGSLYEVDSDGTTRNHIFAGSNRVCTITSSLQGEAEAISFYHQDHLGSSNVITDQNGQEVQRLEYLPYGQVNVNTGTDIVNHKFTGKQLDSSTGLYYYGARYYDPALGRFTQADTIVQNPGNPQTLNRYSYCNNNPINYIDPTGHFAFLAFLFAAVKFIAASAAVGAAVGTVVGGIAGGIQAAVNGGSVFSGIGMGMLYGAMSGAVGGAAYGVGAIGIGLGFGAAAVGSIGGKLALGAFAGAMAGGFSNSIHGGSFGSGALLGGGIGLATAGLGVSPIGRAIGRGIGRTGVGRFLNNVNRSIGSMYSEVMDAAHGSSAGALNTDVGSAATERQALSGRRVRVGVTLYDEKGNVLAPKTTGHRYVGPGEAAAAREGYVPNTYQSGEPKSVFYTPDEGLTSAGQAQRVYSLPQTPTHRLDLDTSNVTNIYSGTLQGGTAVEMITPDKIPVTNIIELQP